MGVFVLNGQMAEGYEPPSASLDPSASVRSRVIEAPPEVTDEDLAWLNAYSCGVRVERSWPVVDIEPDPRLLQIVLR